MTPKVSIIVPIYNAGKFLEKCLDTLVNQTLKDIEIILVLDCPTDGSDRIARRKRSTHPTDSQRTKSEYRFKPQ